MRRLFIFLLFSMVALPAFAGEDDGFSTPTPPTRIISLAPNITEIVYALGAEDRLVGVTDFCNWPEAAKAKPHVGGLMNINFETLFALRPDLVILLPTHQEHLDRLKKWEVDPLLVENETIEEVLESIRLIGNRIGSKDAADRIRKQMIQRLKAVRDRKQERREKKRVLFVVGHDATSIKSVYAAGPNTFLGEVLEAAGGINVLKDRKVRYPMLGKENILALDPDVILDAYPESALKNVKKEDVVKTWQKLWPENLSSRHDIHLLTNPHITIPGPQLVDTVETIETLLYPKPEETLLPSKGN